MNREYFIVAPPYRANSAGVRVLYRLWDELRAAGERCNIISFTWKIPKDSIAIYPEVFPGNMLKADNVVRYVLNKPGLLGGDKVYHEDEKVFVYAEPFVKSVQNDIAGMLHMPSVDLDLFRNKFYVDRPLTCAYIGKGKLDKSLLPPIEMVGITKENPDNREALVELLNKSKVLYNFDPCTIIPCEAALCGCPTVDLSGNHDEYAQCELGTLGTTTIDTQFSIEQARLETYKVRDHFVGLEKVFQKQLKSFIEITQNMNK